MRVFLYLLGLQLRWLSRWCHAHERVTLAKVFASAAHDTRLLRAQRRHGIA